MCEVVEALKQQKRDFHPYYGPLKDGLQVNDGKFFAKKDNLLLAMIPIGDRGAFVTHVNHLDRFSCQMADEKMEAAIKK